MFRLVAVALAIAGCGGGQHGAARALDDYAEALSSRDYDAAYSMMSEEYRAQHSPERFKRLLKENDREVARTAKRLKDGRAGVEVFADFNYGLGDAMRLVREEGRWKIATNPAGFYGQSSPREALRSFVRAYQSKRWAVMLRYVPKRYREQMDAEKVRSQFAGDRSDEMAEMMSKIAAHLDASIDIRGAEARMPYAERYEVRFRREEDGWKIADLD